jgi:uncharacterized protein with von Willebrand factor type A (vWA) domain
LEFIFSAASLLAITLIASFIYYGQIKRAQVEYEESKDIVRNITLGFSKRIAGITRVLRLMEEDTAEARLSAKEALRTGSEALEVTRKGLEETKILSERIKNTEKTLESMKADFQKLVEGKRIPSQDVAVEAPIPVMQDRIIEQLTETEFAVLAIIDELGEGSVPDIKERIQKTREHTARLLKKLYERGYIDRSTNSMPYRYYIRKEIKDIVAQHKQKMKISV